MMAALEWDRDGRDWPNRAASRFISTGGVDWHVQCAGKGPPILLLHGTGAATHSWRDLFGLLAERFSVIAPDLPGHGFSRAHSSSSLSLNGMAHALQALLKALDAAPAYLVGHSAGAAIAVRMTIDRMAAPRAIIGLNAALLPFQGTASKMFSGLARMLVLNPVVPWMFATHAGSGRVIEILLSETGSELDARGVALYRRVAGNSSHVAATLSMMARWDLDALVADLPKLCAPLHLIIGTKDRTVSPSEAIDVKRLLPSAVITRLAGLGHLAHEERPDLVAGAIFEIGARFHQAGAA